jgi:hypothetical protein
MKLGVPHLRYNQAYEGLALLISAFPTMVAALPRLVINTDAKRQRLHSYESPMTSGAHTYTCGD